MSLQPKSRDCDLVLADFSLLVGFEKPWGERWFSVDDRETRCLALEPAVWEETIDSVTNLISFTYLICLFDYMSTCLYWLCVCPKNNMHIVHKPILEQYYDMSLAGIMDEKQKKNCGHSISSFSDMLPVITELRKSIGLKQ